MTDTDCVPAGVVYGMKASCVLIAGPYGSTESVDVRGGYVCAASTWDAKVNQLVALLGGTVGLSRDQLSEVCGVLVEQAPLYTR